MKWFQDHWGWAVLNLFAVGVMAILLGRTLQDRDSFDTLSLALIGSGKWAIRFLLLSLLMTPLNTLFGWRYALKLRKPAGLWAFAFGVVHFGVNVAFLGEEWFRYPIPDVYAALGVIGLSVLICMALTSSQWAMKQLGKWWKRLHRLIYLTGILVMLHAFLEATNKRVISYELQTRIEISYYFVVLAILLLARIPKIRTFLARLKHRRIRWKEAVVGK